MMAPGRTEAAALLLSLDPPPWFLRHSRAVAEVAAWLAGRTERRGTWLDRSLVEAAALLHDTDKILPVTDPARGLPHGEGSAAWLERHGYPELRPAVAAHPVTRLLDEASFQAWVVGAGLEAHVVAYADKRAGQRLESMSARFASWDRRYPGTWSPAERRAVRERARWLEATVCDAAGARPDEVARLRWTGAALVRASAGSRAA